MDELNWERALDSLRGAQALIATDDYDGAASRAYYAAFHAVSALLALDGQAFTKHSALQSAVHRELVKAGRWPVDLGRDFDFCMRMLRARPEITASFWPPMHPGGLRCSSLT